MRFAAALGMVFLVACATSHTDDTKPTAATPEGDAAAPTFRDDGGVPCEGIACNVPSCASGAATAIEGDVYDPAGKAKLYNVRVYVPNAEPEAFSDGVSSCDRCSSPLTGKPIAAALTDEKGHFRLEGVPAGDRIPVVIQIGKFRRKVVLPHVEACNTTTVSDGVLTLPKNRKEGDLPRIAVVTGGFDELGCILQRMGIDNDEFGAPGSEARIHVYRGEGGGGVDTGGDKPASNLWGSADTLKSYDAVLMACEGSEHDETKPAATKQAMVDYVEAGGRVFATHYHYTWLKNSPDAKWQSLAKWNDSASAYGNEVDAVDTSFPKGQALATWLVENGASTKSGSVAVDQPARNVASVDGASAQQWITEPTSKGVRYFSFNAPVGAPEAQQCGRFAFTDVHSREHLGAFKLPSGCDISDMTPQERALEFMIFDLSACIQPDAEKPAAPPIK